MHGFDMGDRNWYRHELTFIVPENGVAEIVIRVKSKLRKGKDFFFDGIVLDAETETAVTPPLPPPPIDDTLPVETETVEWKSVVPANSNHQLYHPRTLAEIVVADLRSQGVGVNPQRTEELLVEALKPYVNRALHFCVDTKKYDALGDFDEKDRKSVV